MREQTIRSLELPAEKFKRKLGVKPQTFAKMLDVLQAREVKKKKRGRTPALCLADQLVLTLSFWREYRTHFHLSEDWGVDESTVRRTIERVADRPGRCRFVQDEDALIRSGEFSLPGRKALRDDHTLEVVVVDIAESPVERPKKQRAYYSGKKKCHTQKSQLFVEKNSRRILCTAYGKGRRHDFKLLEQSRCAHLLHDDTELLSDSGFQGVAKLHSNSRTPHKRWRGKVLTHEQQAHNRTLAKERILAEHVVRKLKVFRILKETYRCLGQSGTSRACPPS